MKLTNQQKEADLIEGISSENELLNAYDNNYNKPSHVQTTYVPFLVVLAHLLILLAKQVFLTHLTGAHLGYPGM